ncbi:hypothetical protein SCHPADRAFT_880401 [Schizopora paradoxa]|uniref:Dynactin subunit 4 n=1 Tax=Schizopora paradoxa TaxID=27342 RepID=A0A0H2RUU3_9AGAM|nr:hypothetical protein SCHPADRAFT_880401 [Schizopora paradoxa]
MSATIKYYCSCLSNTVVPPAPHLPSSSHSFHTLPELYFCEECDAVRCNECVSIEVSGYYCPNCLFEVPSASVRAEKNRCARNCFFCPQCFNTLAVVPSDPPDGTSFHQANSMGEPPFLLYCNNCRWDSAEAGITFEKSTGLAQQLQKHEDSAPDSLEFERLKDFFEPLLRASSSNTQHAPGTSSHSTHTNPITAAASSALARDIPGVSKYHPPPPRSRQKSKHGSKDDMPTYRSRVEIGGINGYGAGGEKDADLFSRLEHPSQVSTLAQKWTGSWSVSPLSRDLKPIRIPLHSRLTKRCPSCRHILIKPEQKAQSVRFKIKLVAANYLPAIEVHLPQPTASTRRVPGARTTQDADQSNSSRSSLLPGKSYPFRLGLKNPLYDPIQVRLVVQRQPLPAVPSAGEASTEKSRRPPFAISLPSTAFSIAPYAEAWEYEDEDDLDGLDDDDGLSPVKAAKGRSKTVGVLEKKANTTIVGGEIVIAKDGRGDAKFNMLVSYTYRSDEPPVDEMIGSKRATDLVKTNPETKTFTFYTVVDLGTIIPKEDARTASPDAY